MATMIPREMEEDNNSYGEKQVFEKLKKLLPPEYIVFHSDTTLDYSRSH